MGQIKERSMDIKPKTTERFLSLIFGGIIFVFWIKYYPSMLSYHEQYQFFLFTTNYFVELVSRPSGFVEYASRFFIQLYYYQWVGALLLAFFLVVLQRMTWRIMTFFTLNDGLHHYWYGFSFIPSIVYWSFLCDENFMLGGLISLLFIVAFSWFCLSISNTAKRFIVSLFSIPVLFYLSGNAFWMPFILVLIQEAFYHKKGLSWKKILSWTIVGCFFSITIVLISYNYLTQYSIWRLIVGLSSFRSINLAPFYQIIGFVSVLLPILFYATLPNIKNSKTVYVGVMTSTLLIIFGGYLLVKNAFDKEMNEYMAYDYHVRHQEWNEIIQLSNNKIPVTPYSVAYLNLAMGKTGQMGSRMFHYFQNGTRGLIPDFTKHYVGALVSSEIYYHLGLVNIGQAHAFEAMESNPNHQKSVRVIQRLVETNMINRQYKVAKKYINLLRQTMFYKHWANEALACIEDSIRFNTHQEWVYLRNVRTTNDFVYSPQEKDMMLGLLYEHDYRNKMAFEYLMAYCLLNKDLPHFVKYFSVGRNLNYAEIPIHFQEALTMFWTHQHGSFQGMPWPINPIVKKNLVNYATIYSKQRGTAKSVMKDQYFSTFWYYYHFGLN